jgi:Na+-translocating ferredoxin:NAD+ oxidoreductase RnfE subunit
LGTSFEPALLFILAPGGFLIYGLLLGIINGLGNRRKYNQAIKEVKAA